MRMRNLLSVAALVCLATVARAEVEVETVLEGLDNPCSVAIQPETGDLFVADSGALRVVRVKGGQAEDVIVGFPQDVYGKGPMYNIGPLGLLFLDKQTLIVGGGGKPDGEEMLRVYKLPEAGGEPLQADQMEASFRLEPDGQIQGEGNFYALAADAQGVYVTSNGDDTKGWVARLGRQGEGGFGQYERFIATKEATQVDAPVGITMSPRGEIVVGQMGEITIPHDSLLTFYNNQGKMLLNLETGLFDIAGVAYSKSGQLYAIDFAWMASEEGGLFQLIAKNNEGTQAVEAKRVATLDKPSSLAFGPDGELYITVFGTAEEGSSQKPGKLLKIASGL